MLAQVFNNGSFDLELAKTLVVLIPKEDNPL